MSLKTLAWAATLVAVATTSRADAPAPVVDNPATPAGGVETLEAEFLWRVGGFDENYLFGIVAASAVGDDGTTYLLDEQLSEVTAIDVEGNEVAKFGREGEGPGEMDRGQDIMVLGDGRIGVLNMNPPKIITFQPDGSLAGDISLAGNEGMNFTPQAMANAEGVVVQTKNVGFTEKKQTSTDVLKQIDPATGETTREILSETSERDRLGEGGRMVITIGGDFVDDWTLFEDGRLAIVRDNEVYEVEIYDGEGNLLRTIRRAGERVPRQESAIEDDIAQRKDMAERFGMPFDEDDVEHLEPMIESLHPRPNGELWVRAGDGLAYDDPEVVAHFDVFDVDGNYVRRVTLRAPYDGAQDRFRIEGNTLVVYEDLVAARGGGFLVMGGNIAQEEEDDEEAEPLAIARYRF